MSTFQNTIGAKAPQSHRTFYSDYVRHCLRFYTRNSIRPDFKSKVDENNWMACSKIIAMLPCAHQDIIKLVYAGYDTLADNVYETAKMYQINQSIIWDLMKDVERNIAKVRGLL